jgi:hypothetical protein
MGQKNRRPVLTDKVRNLFLAHGIFEYSLEKTNWRYRMEVPCEGGQGPEGSVAQYLVGWIRIIRVEGSNE